MSACLKSRALFHVSTEYDGGAQLNIPVTTLIQAVLLLDSAIVRVEAVSGAENCANGCEVLLSELARGSLGFGRHGERCE